MLLYRPTGLRELELVAATDWTRWPPRLPEQPIFYPVLSIDYARKIARDWNSVDESSGFIGFVTRFEIQPAFAKRYRVHTAGDSSHEELWVPAEELAELNRHIVGHITVVESFPGPRFPKSVDPVTHLPEGFRT